MPALFAAEGGYQEFELLGGEWLVLWLSAAAALLAAVGVSAVRRSEVPGLRTGSEVVLGGLMALAVVGAGRMVPTGIIAAITLVAGLALLRAVVAWEFHLRQIPGGATHRDRVVALAVSTVILFAASIGVAALVPGIITIPGTPSARPDPVGPFAILAVGIGQMTHHAFQL